MARARLLWFDVLPKDGKTTLVRCKVPGSHSPKPKILGRLLYVLRRGIKVSTLSREFPRDKNILALLQTVLNTGTVVPDSISGLHWSSETGHSIHIKIQ